MRAGIVDSLQPPATGETQPFVSQRQRRVLIHASRLDCICTALQLQNYPFETCIISDLVFSDTANTTLYSTGFFKPLCKFGFFTIVEVLVCSWIVRVDNLPYCFCTFRVNKSALIFSRHNLHQIFPLLKPLVMFEPAAHFLSALHEEFGEIETSPNFAKAMKEFQTAKLKLVATNYGHNGKYG
jgi:hypothetical protein